MSFFAGKVVIVTGSSNGIGRGTAVLFAKAGAKVTITGKNAATLEETKQQCLRAGAKEGEILELIGEIADVSFNERLISATVAKFGRLDVLVNNVGGVSFVNMGEGIMDIPVAEFDDTIELNGTSPLPTCLATPHLEKTKGAIVNVSSIAAHHVISPIPYYSAAKAALDQITIQMAGSLIKKGIRMYEDMNNGKKIPLGRIGEPEDIGKITLFLADRSQSEILIGHIVTADGGTMLTNPMFADM